MIRSRLIRSSAAATAVVGAFVLLPSASQAAAPAPTPRITSAGAINLVPTPSGLKLGNLTEDTMSSCAIGSGCAARTWERLIGPDANDPNQVLTYQSNVGVLPTVRLARQDMRELSETFRGFIASSGFVGTVKQKTQGSKTILQISGHFDQTLDDWVRIVQVRSGRRTVYIALNLDNRLTPAELPVNASIPAITKKAKAVFKSSWSQVPTTVLP